MGKEISGGIKAFKNSSMYWIVEEPMHMPRNGHMLRKRPKRALDFHLGFTFRLHTISQ